MNGGGGGALGFCSRINIKLHNNTIGCNVINQDDMEEFSSVQVLMREIFYCVECCEWRWYINIASV